MPGDQKKKYTHKYAGLSFIVIFLLLIVSGCSFLGLPNTEQLNMLTLKEATLVYDVNGEVISKLFEENRIVIPLQQIPLSLQQAIIAVEDARFYHHIGIDPISIARAIWVDIKTRSPAEGGSTLTQQLAKNLFLTQEKTIGRKIKEIAMSLLLERKFTKQEILEAYLNQVYLGEGIYGVEAASQLYFGKHANQLTVAESALIAGIPRAPSAYSPYVDVSAAKNRRNVVLTRMAEVGFIPWQQAREAMASEVKVIGKKGRVVQASYFLDYVAQQLVTKYGANRVYKGGLKVYTTLDLTIQHAAENALGKYQGGVISIDPSNGYIKAMVGGKSYQESQVNRVINEVRQPGSAFKPFVYAVALNQGINMNAVIIDDPVKFGEWSPVNYDNKFHGPVVMKKALRQSINIPAVKLLNQVGIDNVLQLANSLGISTLAPEDKHLAIALGGFYNGVNLLELTSAYTAFANQGIWSKPMSIIKVIDEQGNILEKNTSEQKIGLRPEVAYLMTYMLQGTIQNGTGTGANIGRPAAGKTGTTDNYETAWFIGYIPTLVTGIFIGNDNRQPVEISGSQVAVLWGGMMSKAIKNTPVQDFPLPSNIVANIAVCADSGNISNGKCPEVEFCAFIKGTEPQKSSQPAEEKTKTEAPLQRLPQLNWRKILGWNND